MVYRIETEQESDGRWIAEAVGLAGVMAYGATEKEAILNVQTLALRVLADRLEEEKEPADTLTLSVTSRP
jgi:predicted RNase H-like HicB family nuclease